MKTTSLQRGVIEAIILSNTVSVVLFALRIIATGGTQYWFMFWNLFLGWLPVLFAWLLVRSLQRPVWPKQLIVLLAVAWLGFLPNSFYMMSDLIHLQSTGDVGVLFDAVFFLSFIWNGALAGILSMIMVHRQLLRMRHARYAPYIMAIVIVLTSFAIYLGRSLRWNTWDVLVNPAGILFDVTERVVNPLAHPQSYSTTLTFTALIGSMYAVMWAFAKLVPVKKRR